MPALKTRTPVAKSRSDTFSVRLPPQTRYLAELAARSQGRSLGNFIQMAVEQVLQKTYIETYASHGQRVPVLSKQFVNDVWDVDEIDRLAKLAHARPELMTFEEQVLYKRLRAQHPSIGNLAFTHLEYHPDRKQIDEDWRRLKAELADEIKTRS